MEQLKEKDLPNGLRHLLTYWQGEEVDPDILEKICDGEISEEEEVKMFLEWCKKEDKNGELSPKLKQELQEVLKMS